MFGRAGAQCYCGFSGDVYRSFGSSVVTRVNSFLVSRSSFCPSCVNFYMRGCRDGIGEVVRRGYGVLDSTLNCSCWEGCKYPAPFTCCEW